MKIIEELEKDYTLQSIGFDGWGVDFVPLDGNDNKLMDPMRYFSMFKGQEKIKREIEENKAFINHHVPGQFQPFNTVYQLMYLQKMYPNLFNRIKKIVPLPSYLAGKLCGTYKYEFTHASTTQLFDFEKNTWCDEICQSLEIGDILPEVVPSGTIIGRTKSGINCMLPATHDTASAYAAISSNLEDTMIISAGTWCLNGVVINHKKLDSDFILKNNLAVEGCHDGSLRILSNTPGLFFWQKIKSELEQLENRKISYTDMLLLSLKSKDFKKTVDIDDDKYLRPINILNALKKEMQTDNIGEILCGVLNSLAIRIKKTKEILEMGLNLSINRVHMIGGGIQNTLLCEKISEHLNMEVLTGPVEGTAFGNALIQMISEYGLSNKTEHKKIIEKSFKIKKFELRK